MQALTAWIISLMALASQFFRMQYSTIFTRISRPSRKYCSILMRLSTSSSSWGRGTGDCFTCATNLRMEALIILLNWHRREGTVTWWAMSGQRIMKKSLILAKLEVRLQHSSRVDSFSWSKLCSSSNLERTGPFLTVSLGGGGGGRCRSKKQGGISTSSGLDTTALFFLCLSRSLLWMSEYISMASSWVIGSAPSTSSRALMHLTSILRWQERNLFLPWMMASCIEWCSSRLSFTNEKESMVWTNSSRRAQKVEMTVRRWWVQLRMGCWSGGRALGALERQAMKEGATSTGGGMLLGRMFNQQDVGFFGLEVLLGV